MRLIADVHISPCTVHLLSRIGHDVIPVQSVLPADARDDTIVLKAVELSRAILTQDLGFSGIFIPVGQLQQ